MQAALFCYAFGLLAAGIVQAGENLLPDPSFEQPKPKDRWGLVFTKWGGWIYEGQCEFRVSDIAHSGQHSLLIVGGTNPKIRASPSQLTLDPGRYRITAFLRGLDIGTGIWNQTTEFMFEEKYLPLRKNGTFGWTRLTYVGEVKQRREFGHPSFGLMAPGYLWVDDVTVEQVGEEVALTPEPLLGLEEQPIAPPGELGTGAVRCIECGYRNMLDWSRCYACGAALELIRTVATGPAVRLITSFEERNPFDGGALPTPFDTSGTSFTTSDPVLVAVRSVTSNFTVTSDAYASVTSLPAQSNSLTLWITRDPTLNVFTTSASVSMLLSALSSANGATNRTRNRSFTSKVNEHVPVLLAESVAEQLTV